MLCEALIFLSEFFRFFKLVPSVLLVPSFLPLVVFFFSQFCPSSATDQKDKTKQKNITKSKNEDTIIIIMLS